MQINFVFQSIHIYSNEKKLFIVDIIILSRIMN